MMLKNLALLRSLKLDKLTSTVVYTMTWLVLLRILAAFACILAIDFAQNRDITIFMK